MYGTVINRGSSAIHRSRASIRAGVAFTCGAIKINEQYFVIGNDGYLLNKFTTFHLSWHTIGAGTRLRSKRAWNQRRDWHHLFQNRIWNSQSYISVLRKLHARKQCISADKIDIRYCPLYMRPEELPRVRWDSSKAFGTAISRRAQLNQVKIYRACTQGIRLVSTGISQYYSCAVFIRVWTAGYGAVIHASRHAHCHCQILRGIRRN